MSKLKATAFCLLFNTLIPRFTTLWLSDNYDHIITLVKKISYKSTEIFEFDDNQQLSVKL